MNIQNNLLRQSEGQQTINDKSTGSTPVYVNAIARALANNAEIGVQNKPVVFNIPSFAIPQNTSTSPTGATPSKLNKFILGKLNASEGSNSVLSLKLPDIQFNNPIKLSSASYKSSITTINQKITDLHISDDRKVDIDLASTLNPSVPANEPKAFEIDKIESLDVPFVDSDVSEKLKQIPQDEDCQIDVSRFRNRRFISVPSKFGLITCLKFKQTKNSHRVSHSFHAKHVIECFNFEALSPDDFILASLQRPKQM